MNIFAISGSLRVGSSNTAILRAMATLAPPTVSFTLYEGLGSLPHYSPEIDTDAPPVSVQGLRDRFRAADAVIICTPEYAHGMPGSLKNALDWVVSSGEFDGGKTTAAISASPSFQGGDKALAWLVQTLTVLGADIPIGASLPIPFSRTKIHSDGEISDPATAIALNKVLDALITSADHKKTNASLP